MLEQWLTKRPDDAVVRNALAESLGRFSACPRRATTTNLLKRTGSNAVRNNLAEVLLRSTTRALALASGRCAGNNPNARHRWLGRMPKRASWTVPSPCCAMPACASPALPTSRYHLVPCWRQDKARDEALAGCAPPGQPEGPRRPRGAASLAGHAPDPLIAAAAQIAKAVVDFTSSITAWARLTHPKADGLLAAPR